MHVQGASGGLSLQSAVCKALRQTNTCAYDGGMTTSTSAQLFRMVEEEYRHVTKAVRPMPPLSESEVLLKWYSLAVEERRHSDAEIAEAQAFILAEARDGRLGVVDEVGFVVQHRIAAADVFYVCSWRGNNELWETHYVRTLDTGMFEMASHGTRFPTFCVWVLAIVDHESRAWSRYLRSPRDAAARDAYVADQLSGDVV